MYISTGNNIFVPSPPIFHKWCTTTSRWNIESTNPFCNTLKSKINPGPRTNRIVVDRRVVMVIDPIFSKCESHHVFVFDGRFWRLYAFEELDSFCTSRNLFSCNTLWECCADVSGSQIFVQFFATWNLGGIPFCATDSVENVVDSNSSQYLIKEIRCGCC